MSISMAAPLSVNNIISNTPIFPENPTARFPTSDLSQNVSRSRLGHCYHTHFFPELRLSHLLWTQRLPRRLGLASSNPDRLRLCHPRRTNPNRTRQRRSSKSRQPQRRSLRSRHLQKRLRLAGSLHQRPRLCPPRNTH